MSQVVWGEGPFSARVIILGQNPGPEEMDAGQPFVGGSGRVLNRALQRVGLSRSRCYVTNIVKHYVPPGKPVPRSLVELDRPLLQKELDMLKDAKVILTLGAEAFNELTGKTFHTRHNRKSAEKRADYWLRGAPYLLGDKWIVPAVHPSFIMRTGFIESPLFEVDCDRARRFAEGATPPDEHYNYSATDHEVIEYTKECIATGECGLDIETPESTVDDDELDPLYITPIELIGLSCNVGEAIGVRPDQYELIRPLLEGNGDPSRRTTCWTFNGGNFDFYHLGKQFSLEGIKRADAMLGMHLLWPHLTNKDAATCFSIFCDIPYYKNTRLLLPEFYNTVGNCRDTYGALWAGRNILREMRKFPRMENLFWNMMSICDELNNWRVIGVNTDQQFANRAQLTLMRMLAKYEEWWAANLPHYSWTSSKQLIEMFRAMGMPIYKRKRVKKDEDGNKKQSLTETMDDEALEEYIKRGNKTAGLIQTMRGLKKSSDFFNLVKADNRIHPRIKQHGQVGGRLQAVDGNVQTLPEELNGVFPRGQVIPDKPDEQVLFVSDFSQIEYRLYVKQANDPVGIAQVESGDYLYGFFYEDIFQEPFFTEGLPRTKRNIRKDVPPWKLLVAKSWPLGFIYGRGVPDVVGLPITQQKSKAIYTDFHAKHAPIGVFHTELVFKAEREGYLRSPYGRIRRFPNPKAARNEILAFPGQSVAVDVLINNAIIPLPSVLKREFGGRLMFTVHDSVIGCCAKSAARDCVQYIRQTMQAPLTNCDASLEGLVIPCEIKIGPNWADVMSPEKYFEDAGRTVTAV